MIIEEKALALVNEITEARLSGFRYIKCLREEDSRWEALCRAVKSHEANKAMYEQRLADPDGKVKALGPRPHEYIFTPGGPKFSVSRVKSPGFAGGWRKNWRSGEIAPHRYNSCGEFVGKNFRTPIQEKPNDRD